MPRSNTPLAAPFIALLLTALLAACSTLAPALPEPRAQDQACRDWFERFDAVTQVHGVADGAAARVPGFPFLRSDRLHASYREALPADAWPAWLDGLGALGAQARAIETANLPDGALADLGVSDKAGLRARSEACAQSLSDSVRQDPRQQAALRARALVPDDYELFLRTLGLYPITRLPFFAGVERWQQRWGGWFEAAAQVPDGAPGWTRYTPPPAPEGVLVVPTLARDALGLLRPDAATAERLLQAYAPVIEVETRGDADRFGRLAWGQGPAPEVRQGEPVVYQRLAQTRWGDSTLLQLIYSVWFPERPASGAFDLLAGRLDGVVLRLTLDAQGRVLLFDSIHACGCYHLFVPTPALVPRPAPAAGTEWAFVPATLPALAPGQRLRVRLSAGEHQVVGVHPVVANAVPAAGLPYRLIDEDELRRLPLPGGGGTRSVYGPDGIVAGSERAERWLFWPMGIASPGAMRQWGRQPTAFVGRRHFDDARLIEQRFAPAPAPQ
jgi:hypothetical protein